jgi:O-succinylbenzoic acid--CoA ligase
MERAELAALAEATGCVVAAGGGIILRDPSGGAALPGGLADPEGPAGRGWLAIATGGSSGLPRWVRHDEVTLTAAVAGFLKHFGLERVRALDVLPPYHVSGFMARVRCAATGGEHRPVAWKDLESGLRPNLPPGEWVVSLVPTQLQRLLKDPAAVDWLRRFRAVLVGGAAMWPELEEAARAARLPLSPSYGMTETAAMVTALLPEEFLAGMRSSGRALPHARVAVAATGVVTISSESLFRGYWPAWRAGEAFETEDLGRVDPEGHLHVLGRRDAVINSGGKKIHPLPVEAALRASGEFADVAVVGLPDPEWGEAVVAFYPRASRIPDLAKAVAGLAAHERPKRFFALDDWPRNPQGKINRSLLRARGAGS